MNKISNVISLTHRVHFRKPGMEPQLLNAEDAEKLLAVRDDPAYDKSAAIQVGYVNCEIRDISLIEKLQHAQVKRGYYRCENERCNNENRMHKEGELCEYTYTAKCVKCDQQVWERDRYYAMAKWGKVLCRRHSPFGHADELFPGESTPELSRMRGMAAYYIEKGLNDEEVMEAVNKDLKKWGGKQL